MCPEERHALQFEQACARRNDVWASDALHHELLCDPVNAAVVDRPTAGSKVQVQNREPCTSAMLKLVGTGCWHLLARSDCMTTASTKLHHHRYDR